jgi:integrative and conjugative element protein (TIGR02256 family)
MQLLPCGALHFSSAILAAIIILDMTIWIPSKLYEEMAGEASEWEPLETGGALMGYVSESKDIVVTGLIDAGPLAQRTKTTFSHDFDYQSDLMAQMYEASGRLDRYLGDWHTHPKGSRRMSFRDRRTLRHIAMSESSQNSYPVMLVLSGDHWTISAWQFLGSTFYGRARLSDMAVRFF